jgi:hypothetical protein
MLDGDWLRHGQLASLLRMLHDASGWMVVGRATCTFVFHRISIRDQRDGHRSVEWRLRCKPHASWRAHMHVSRPRQATLSNATCHGEVVCTALECFCACNYPLPLQSLWSVSGRARRRAHIAAHCPAVYLHSFPSPASLSHPASTSSS